MILRVVFTILVFTMVWRTESQGQEIVGPTAPIAEHSLARAKVEGVDNATWMILPADRVDFIELEGGKQVAFAAPPGSYIVLAAVVVDGKPRFLHSSVVVRAESETNEPSPPGGDKPPALETNELERAARAYVIVMPVALREAAAEVRAGRASTVNGVVDYVAQRREQARQAYGKALDEATKGAFDATGRITDPTRYATALEEGAAAMDGKP
jgi:hypothetical protein